MLAKPHSARMFVCGTDIYWTEVGEGRPLILLHGLADSGRTFNRVVPLLARRRRVIIPDLPGHGRSGRPAASYDLDWYCTVMARWIRELGVDEIDLLGHSLGGGIAQRLLLEGIQVRRLSLVSSGGFGQEVAWPIRLASLPGVLERIGQPLMHTGTRVGVHLCGGRFTRADRAHLSEMNGRPGSARALHRTIRSVVNLRGQSHHFLDYADRLPALPPIAAFWGMKDPIIPVHHAYAIENLLEGVTLRQFSCGHYPHREIPHAFSSALERFLEEPQTNPVMRAGVKKARLMADTDVADGQVAALPIA